MRNPLRHSKRAAKTFGDIRRECEQKLARGLALDFDKIMLEIDAVRRRAGKPAKN